MPPAVFPERQILLNQPLRHRVNGNEPSLIAFALYAEVHDTLAALHVADPQVAKLFPADAVIEQGRQYRAIPYTLQRVRGRGFQQTPCLCVAQGRRAAFIIISHRPLDPIHGIAGHGIALAEIIKERGKRRELAPDAGVRQVARLQMLSPGNNV